MRLNLHIHISGIAVGTTCFVCGPTSFVEVATDLLIASGHGRDKIRTERFGPTGDRK
jgi:ferredoxin-NADP reductase